jgi:hypothetical protein
MRTKVNLIKVKSEIRGFRMGDAKETPGNPTKTA